MKLIILSLILFSHPILYAQAINSRVLISEKIMTIYQDNCQIKSEESKNASKIKSAF